MALAAAPAYSSAPSSAAGPALAHAWVSAATVTLTERQARLALLRGSVRLPDRLKIVVLDVYCSYCKGVFEDIADTPCSALLNNEHLRGGPIGTRKKRTKPTLVPAGEPASAGR